MPDLYITSAQPNPLGKDKPRYAPPTNSQLNNEWVEFTNPTDTTWDLQGVRLTHDTFDDHCRRTGQFVLMAFSGSIAPGYSVRVHTGSGEASTTGTRTHLYAGRRTYAWNNVCGDKATLYANNGVIIDFAAYSPDPPEGQVLRRVPNTNQLR